MVGIEAGDKLVLRDVEGRQTCELAVAGAKISANVTILPLVSTAEKRLGYMIVIEDISNEKRMKSTMSKYMDSGLADKLMEGEDEIFSRAW